MALTLAMGGAMLGPAGLPGRAEGETDLARNKPVTASSTHSDPYKADYTVDGDSSTRWASQPGDEHDITVDLGDIYDITRIRLNWEGACAARYEIQVSNDNAYFTTVRQVSDGTPGERILEGLTGTGRYIRIKTLTASNAGWGVSLWDFEVYGHLAQDRTDLARNKPVYASSSLEIDGQSYPKEYAVDGNPTTRWSSQFNKSGEWITVDLGALIDIRRVELTWSDHTWAGKFKIQVSNDNEVFTDMITHGAAAQAGLQILPVSGTGRYIRLWADEAAGDFGISLFSFCVYGQPAEDQALNKTVYASASKTVDGASYPKEYAVDGDPATRWSSEFNQTGEWIAVDLGARTDISRVVLHWSNAAFGKRYRIQVSDDNLHYRDILSDGGAESDGVQTLNVSGTGRYVRMYAEEASHAWGVSLWTFEVYGSPADAPRPQAYTLTFNKGDPRDLTLPVDWQGYTLTAVRTDAGEAGGNQYTVDDTGLVFNKEFILSLLEDSDKGEFYVDATKENGRARTLTFTVVNAREPDPAVEADRLPQGSERLTLSLDGWWACEKTAFAVDEIPAVFTNAIPVPGLWDMADQDLGGWDGSALWYKRTVTLAEAPVHAVLRINKGGYGKYLYVNGRYVGAHQYNHTAAEIDITPYLQAGDNEIVIKIGFAGSQPQGEAHNGFDGEKGEYQPGLYDSVSLILNNGATVGKVQSAPDLEDGSLKITAQVENTGDQTLDTPVKAEILDRDGAVKGSKTLAVTVPAGDSAPVDFGKIDISGFSPDTTWSPENPYLYTLRITTAGDTYETRVGMRTFRFDEETKLPLLNGQVYYLRGTNITIGRFFEDPQRGDKPWDKDWVTALIRQCKKVNWNCARYCVGFPPEIFYEAADELGFLVMDEYPYWQPDNHGACTCGCTVETLVGEATQWIYERNNHPCVILWDMQNESPSFGSLTGEVIRQLRSLDLQNRPWDNGWGEPMEETDPLECHPYPFFDANFRLSNLDQMSNRAWWVKDLSAYPNPQIINEYGWLWLTRNGEPTPLTQDLYDQLLPGATPEERQTYYADALATLTEFWRVGRHHAGVLQFCVLSYDIPGRYTCDVLCPDLTTPEIPEYMAKKLRNAFSPVGIVIEKYAETYAPGSVQSLPVSILNDLQQEQNLEVELVLYKDDQVQSSQKAVYTVAAAGKVTQNFTLNIPEIKGSYRIVARYVKDGETVESERKITVGEDLSLDPVYGLEYGRPVEASSRHSDPYKAEYATDRNPMSRWASQAESENEWITVDLGKSYDISKVRLVWELAYAREYKVQVSDDNVSFTTIHDGTCAAAGEQVLEGLTGTGRYVRIQITKAFEPFWGVSLYTFNVWGEEAEPSSGGDTTASQPEPGTTVPSQPSGSSETTVPSTAETSASGEDSGTTTAAPNPGTGTGGGAAAAAWVVLTGAAAGLLLWKRKKG